MRRTSPSRPGRRGFTLIELIVVIVILGILAALAIPTFAGVIARSQDETTLNSLEAVARDAQALAALEARDVTFDDVDTAADELGAVAATGVSAANWDALPAPDGDSCATGAAALEFGHVYVHLNASNAFRIEAVSAADNIMFVDATATSVTDKGRACESASTPTPTTTTTTAPAVAPSAVQNLTATPGNGLLAVGWDAPAALGTGGLAAYDVSVSPNHGTVGQIVIIDDTSPAGTSIIGLTNGTTYTVTVTATNGAGLTGPVASGTATPAAPLVVSVHSWGNNDSGRLGDGTQTNRSLPVSITGGSLVGKTITQLAGGETSFALAADGTVHAWGDNTYGQIGDGTTTDRLLPIATATGGSLTGKTVTQITTGYAHTVALASDGSVHAWGYNNAAQVGDGSTINRSLPIAIGGSLAGKTITQISAGDGHTIALASDGTIHAWGYNSGGRLGDGTQVQRTTPVLVGGGSVTGKTITQVVASAVHTIAVASDGTVHTWGDNASGQLGDGTSLARFRPVQVAGSLAGKTITQVTAGQHTVALASDGTVHAWGQNWAGQVGDGTTTNRQTPTQLGGTLQGKTAVHIGAASHQTMVVTSDGSIHSWGYNSLGTLADGTTTNRLAPVAAGGGSLVGKNVTLIAGGLQYFVVLATG